MTQWTTKIAESSADKTIIRGYPIEDCIEKLSFAEMTFLLWLGRRANKHEAKLFNAMLVACAEHGIAPPSITAARIVKSGGNSMNTSIAAGILACGDYHGGAIENSMKLIKEHFGRPAAQVIAEYREQKKRLAGFGHKIYKTDPRAQKLLELAEKEGIAGGHVRFALELEKELEKATGKKFCINVDGAIAAILCEMHVDPRFGKGVFALARTAGIVAHVFEESNERPFRRLETHTYTGEKKKELDDN